MRLDTTLAGLAISAAGMIVKFITDSKPADRLRELCANCEGREVESIQKALDIHRLHLSSELNRILPLTLTGKPESASEMEITAPKLDVAALGTTFRASEEWIRRLRAAQTRAKCGQVMFGGATIAGVVLLILYALHVNVPEWLTVCLLIASGVLAVLAIADAIVRSLLIDAAADRFKVYRLGEDK